MQMSLSYLCSDIRKLPPSCIQFLYGESKGWTGSDWLWLPEQVSEILPCTCSYFPEESEIMKFIFPVITHHYILYYKLTSKLLLFITCSAFLTNMYGKMARVYTAHCNIPFHISASIIMIIMISSGIRINGSMLQSENPSLLQIEFSTFQGSTIPGSTATLNKTEAYFFCRWNVQWKSFTLAGIATYTYILCLQL